MNNKFFGVTLFVVGAIAGSVVTARLLKTKYEDMANDEIETVKEALRKTRGSVDEALDAANKERIKRYSEELRRHDYAGCSEEKTDGEEENPVQGPYVIPPDDYGEFEDYEQISLTYYSVDKVLTYDDDGIVDDVINTVGEDALERFGEFEEDCVFVRDDWRKCDYEILCDNRAYSDVVGKAGCE